MVAAMGGIWIAMRIAMASSQMPACRGGVFAVFAKISPPTCECPPFPCRVVVKTVGTPWVGGVKADNDAARRVATSFEKLGE